MGLPAVALCQCELELELHGLLMKDNHANTSATVVGPSTTIACPLAITNAHQFTNKLAQLPNVIPLSDLNLDMVDQNFPLGNMDFLGYRQPVLSE